MHSVGRCPPFSCIAVKAGTISSITVISAWVVATQSMCSGASCDRRVFAAAPGTVWTSSHRRGGLLAGSQANSS
jgi:hypothetical protein